MQKGEISSRGVLSLSLCAFLGMLMITSTISEAYAKSEAGHIYLYQKDPSSWTIVEGGAWGKLNYKRKGDAFEFVFNGHKLKPNTDYKLIYYADPWPGKGLNGDDSCGGCLAEGTSNNGGNIHLAGTYYGCLPHEEDWNHKSHVGQNKPPGHNVDCMCGAKIWLVLADDYSDNPGMEAWNPDEYLFENSVIPSTP